ncbi:GntR family transcriptional regulator [Bordetella sp. 02P26C-1]|uniref:GntR family transcriptional regulator n=1 Tax=Bordetella sp. 02P26C-1 TaxID=2683195 RepID=UPI001354EC16|nr:GntR family transcriptional regulator [Bordetella sp. 02P26C-1]MVW78114.1 UTRA domain-containing protein [Bordetella sp. 02P26C-1]
MKKTSAQSSISSPKSEQDLALRQPLYVVVAHTLQKEIEQGKYTVGSVLPTEEMLVDRFQVSRHTIRQALRELKDQGLIQARAGIGTIVRTQPGKIWMMSGLNSLVDLLEFATETEMHILSTSTVTADRHLVKMIKCELGAKWLHMEILRCLPDQPRPLSFLKVYVQPKYAPKLKKLKHMREPIYAVLEREYGVRIAEVRQELTADSLDHDIAELVDATPGQAALSIIRHYYDSRGELVQIALGYYPSGRYTQTTRIHSKLDE